MYREIAQQIKKIIKKPGSRIILLLGLRQTGKTTLVKTICEKEKHQIFNFDIISDRKEFTQNDRYSLADFYERFKNKIIVIDEIQKMSEATQTIKYLYDQYKMKFILTGSSELKIKQNFGDSLAGRLRIFRLYPLSIKEILVQEKKIKENKTPDYELSQSKLQKYLIYGSLPAIENMDFEEYPLFLRDFTETLLSKDILEISGIKKSTKIYLLLKFLAMQVGQLVNVNELSSLTEISRPSIYNYLDILEKMNIIIYARPISTNERRAISEKFKIYFTDLGIRNFLINNFESFNIRIDRGALLENATYVGIKRKLDYEGKIYKMGFFRSKTGSEIDIVIKVADKEYLYEVKSAKKFLLKKGNVEYITLENIWKYF
ncbi:MAG: ATP-binding protein [Patescibacteria group bacterium]